MALPALLAPVVTWIFRDVVVKFVVLGAVFALVAYFTPIALQHLGPYLGTTSLNSAFVGLDAGVWWWLEAFRLDFGVPAMISALVARFLIRRLPVIG